MAKALRQLEQRIKQVDLVLEVRDARVPLSSFNPHLEKLVAAKRRLVLLNKTDLADPAATRAATALLAQQAGLRVLPCQALDGRSAGRVLDALLDCMQSDRSPAVSSASTAATPASAGASPSFASGPAALAPAPTAAPPDLRLVLVAGLPNTGKSSLINALKRAAAARGLLDGEQAWRKTARAGPLPGVTTALGGFRVCRGQQGQAQGQGARPDDDTVGHVYVLDSPGVLAPALRDMGHGQLRPGLPPKPGGGGGAGGGAGGGGGGSGGRRGEGKRQLRGQERGHGGEAAAARLAIAGLLPADGRGGVVEEGRVLRHLVQLLMSDPRRLRELWCAADSQVHHLQLREQQLRELRGGGSGSSRGSSSSGSSSNSSSFGRDGGGGGGGSSSTSGDVRLARLVHEAVTAPLEQLLPRGGAESGRWHPGLEDELEERHEDGAAAVEAGRGRTRSGSNRSHRTSSSEGRSGGGGGRWDPLAAAAEVAAEDERQQQHTERQAQERAAAGAAVKRQRSSLDDPSSSSSAAAAMAAREEPVTAAEADARGGGGGGAAVDVGRRTAAQRAVLTAFRSGALGRYTWDDVPLAVAAAPTVTAAATAAAATAAAATAAAAAGNSAQPQQQVARQRRVARQPQPAVSSPRRRRV
ncbi:hypothetical protein HXX76_001036 [Chlamydomonas incerta]|uniref:CP-type G domain-containing protein n=1 Tax=Chlamydomonas incerta TaxID=51695 RepID=A0A836B165_CHLIN|nr:hypothetical protein HXX76_001036 [Chlamydomonas incerta]|eukprot:KAG2444279.1 hypothetical protein HXX76_001036 [Chlamydomonas incerta]